MELRENILQKYISAAPLALAFERTIESRIYGNLKEFERPILDIGCGEGLFANLVFKEKIDTGIDPNPQELEEAQRLGGYNELIECWGAKIPKPDAFFNTILSNSVLEHIPDLKPVLNEAFRVLKPGGHFYFTVPSEKFDQYTWISQFLELVGLNGLREKFRKFFNNFWAHYHYYPLEKWKQLGKEAGFEVVEAYTYSPKRVCMLNTFLTPFAVPQLLVKKVLNRWVVFPPIRRLLSFPLSMLSEPLLKNGERAEAGGLVFVALRKGASL